MELRFGFINLELQPFFRVDIFLWDVAAGRKLMSFSIDSVEASSNGGILDA